MLFFVFSRADATFASFLFESIECGCIYPSKIKAFCIEMCGIVSGFPLQCFKEFVRLTYSSDPDQTNVKSHADIALALLLN